MIICKLHEIIFVFLQNSSQAMVLKRASQLLCLLCWCHVHIFTTQVMETNICGHNLLLQLNNQNYQFYQKQMSSYGLWLTSMEYLQEALIAQVILFNFAPDLTLGSHQPCLFMKTMCKRLLHLVVWLPFLSLWGEIPLDKCYILHYY